MNRVITYTSEESGNNQKLSEDLNMALEIPIEAREKSRNLNTGFDEEANTVELIVKFNGNILEAATEFGGYASSLLGGYGVVTIPADRIEEFAALDMIEYVEKPHRLYFEITSAARAACINPVWNPPFNLSGEGCIVAVIDSGIDWKHPDFINENGTSRILKIWDQTISPERSGLNAPVGYFYGTEYTREAINGALSGNEEFLSAVNLSRDFSGHGTAVTGIAAGNGRSSNGVNRGIAYGAELLIVKLGNSIGNTYPRTTRLMEAVNYVLEQAQEAGKPVAVNLSFGNNQGSHDGTDLLSTYLDTAGGVWKNVISCGTGNEAGAGTHTAGRLGGNGKRDVEMAVGAFELSLNVQLWKNYGDIFEIELTAPSGQRFGPLNPQTPLQNFRTANTEIYVYYGEPSPYSRYQLIYFELIPRGEYIDTGVWTFHLTPLHIIDGRYDMWLPVSQSINQDTRFFFPEENITLTVPSAAEKVISVGAYNSRTNTYADFSGRGFTRVTNQIKPDLIAPGVDITTTAVNGGYAGRTGTSFATPFVTGASALLMEWGIVKGNDSFLYGEKVKAYLIRGAKQLPGLDTPNPQTGWGALCLRAGFPI